MENKMGFFKNHADAIAIITVNIAIAAIMTTMWISNTHRVDCTNTRADQLHSTLQGETTAFRSEMATSTANFRSEMADANATFRAEMAVSNARSDRLYEMFVDLLKEGRK